MIKRFAIGCLAATFLAGCTTTDPYTGQQKMSNTAGGAMIGTAVGALTGLAIGGGGKSGRNAALIGAGIGALSGGAIGKYMDRQESEVRALSVANYLTQQGIDNRRFDVQGYGPTQPVATNATEAGRAQNRRVEIQISPLTE